MIVTVFKDLYPKFIKKEALDNDSSLLIFIAALVAIITTLLSILLMRTRTGELRPFNVALIGFPQSGKTTLIVTLFQEIFSQKIRYAKATLKGESTIERLNQQIELKESGRPLGPTNDQTMFAYRTNIETGTGFFKEEYKVEFGDYPGEYSEQLSESEYFSELKKTEFFKWSVEADAYIFIVDVGKYLSAFPNVERDRFVATTSKAIRQSWQHFLDYNISSLRKAKQKPVLLLFNKMDLCNYLEPNHGGRVQTVEIRKEASTKHSNVPKVSAISDTAYFDLIQILEKDFDNLIQYLNSDVANFKILFTSNFGTINGKFADIDKILRYILPRKLLLPTVKKIVEDKI
jgi:GTPase Era involved in 16S rRNA processing